MKALTQASHSDESECYIIIYEKEKKRFTESKPRCLVNFKDYVVIGVMERFDIFDTYTLSATPNLPEYYRTTVWDSAMTEGIEGIIEIPNDEIQKAMNIRAKDLMMEIS